MRPQLATSWLWQFLFGAGGGLLLGQVGLDLAGRWASTMTWVGVAAALVSARALLHQRGAVVPRFEPEPWAWTTELRS